MDTAVSHEHVSRQMLREYSHTTEQVDRITAYEFSVLRASSRMRHA